MASFQVKVSCEVREMEKIKIFVPFRSYPPHNRKFQKNSIKIVKIKKISLRIHFQPKQVGKGLERGKIKILIPFRSNTTRCRKFQKNWKKIQKIKKYNYGFI